MTALLQDAVGLLESITDGLLVIGPDWTIRHMNKHAERLLERSRGELQGRNLWIMFPEAVQGQFYREYHRAWMAQEPIRFEDYYRPLQRWFEVHAWPSEDALYVFFQDITPRKQTEEALRASEARFRSIFQSAAIGMVAVDRSARLLQVNSAFCRFLGYREEELLGRPVYEVTHPEDLAESMRVYEKLVEGGNSPVHLEKRYVRQDGSTVWGQTTVTWALPFGEPANYCVGLIQDITARKQAQERLQSSEEQLRRLAAGLQTAREEERANIAREVHDELGQMLTRLKIDLTRMNRCLLQRQEPLAAEAGNMLELVGDTIRSVQRISASLRPGVLHELGLVPAIEWQVREFEKHTGIMATFWSRSRMPELPAEISTAVFRILQEALTNVARHSGATLVSVTLRSRPGMVLLKVQDNGRGITVAEMEALGSLGLLGMRERALMFGGTVRIRGVGGQGTTVRLCLPGPGKLAGGEAE